MSAGRKDASDQGGGLSPSPRQAAAGVPDRGRAQKPAIAACRWRSAANHRVGRTLGAIRASRTAAVLTRPTGVADNVPNPTTRPAHRSAPPQEPRPRVFRFPYRRARSVGRHQPLRRRSAGRRDRGGGPGSLVNASRWRYCCCRRNLCAPMRFRQRVRRVHGQVRDSARNAPATRRVLIAARQRVDATTPGGDSGGTPTIPGPGHTMVTGEHHLPGASLNCRATCCWHDATQTDRFLRLPSAPAGVTAVLSARAAASAAASGADTGAKPIIAAGLIGSVRLRLLPRCTLRDDRVHNTPPRRLGVGAPATGVSGKPGRRRRPSLHRLSVLDGTGCRPAGQL